MYEKIKAHSLVLKMFMLAVKNPPHSNTENTEFSWKTGSIIKELLKCLLPLIK
jgi:hypothetical protein